MPEITEQRFVKVSQNITCTIDSGLAQLTLNRPEVGNKITLPMLAQIQRFITDASLNPDVRVVVLKAEGNDFCLGRDSNGESRVGLSPWESRDIFMVPILQTYAAMRHCAVPTVALVKGHARGFGCALAGSCAITLTNQSAGFSLPEIEDGIPPLLAMSALCKRVQAKALVHIVYTAQTITSQQALNIGLVSHIYPDADFAEESQLLIEKLAQRPRKILTAIGQFSAAVQSREASYLDEYASSLLAIARAK